MKIMNIGFSTFRESLSMARQSETLHNSTYRKLSIIRRTKFPNLNVSRLDLQLSLRNILKPSVKWKMKMQLEQRRQASE